MSGFNQPSIISNALCCFLGVKYGTRVSRIDTTRVIVKYIKDHDLQIQEDRRKFILDNKLSLLLGPPIYPYIKARPEEKGYSFFNLQKYLSPHFISLEQRQKHLLWRCLNDIPLKIHKLKMEETLFRIHYNPKLERTKTELNESYKEFELSFAHSE